MTEENKIQVAPDPSKTAIKRAAKFSALMHEEERRREKRQIRKLNQEGASIYHSGIRIDRSASIAKQRKNRRKNRGY